MINQNWRKELDPVLNKHINQLLKETKKFDKIIKKAEDSSKAQMWVALGLIEQKIHTVKFAKKEYQKKLSKKELDSLLKTIETL